MKIHVIETKLNGVLVIETEYARDERGMFIESYHREQYTAHGIAAEFVQDNHSRSTANVLRGLHYQDMRSPQAKLLRCIAGKLWDVAVDIRVGSPTFGKWIGIELSAENMRQLFLPVGFAHGFVALLDGTELFYKCSDYYSPIAEGTIAWDDPDLGIEWPVTLPILSARDRAAQRLRDYREMPAFHI